MLQLNLRLKIVLTMVFLILIPLLLANFYLTFQMQESIKENTMNNLELLSYTTGNEIEKIIETRIDEITVLSNNPVLKDNTTSKFEKLNELNITQNYHKIFEDITLIDTSGNVIVSTTYNYQGEWITNQYFQVALQGNITVSDAHVLPSPFKVIMIFLSPVFNNNDEIIGVVSGQIDMKNIWDIVDNIKIGDTGFIYIINNDEKILAHPNKDLIFSKIDKEEQLSSKMITTSGSFLHSNENNTDVICGYSSILGNTIYDGTGSWKLIIVQDSNEVLSSVALFQIQILYIGVFFFIILILVGFIFSRSFIKPIHTLKKGMEEVGNGNLNYQVVIKSKDELQYLGESFNTMTIELKLAREGLRKRTEDVEKLLKQKDEFINQLSHDLKTPITPLITLLPIIKKGVKEPKIKEMIEVTIHSVKILKELIFKTLNLAKLNAPGTEFDFIKVDLRLLVEKIIKNQLIVFLENKVHVEDRIATNIFVMADELRLGEIFENLLSNAVKYMPGGGKIIVDAEVDKEFVKISIKDSGIGLSKEELEFIFNEFYKVDESRHDLGSSGLGLTICKRIVKKHDGRIWAESPGKGKGTTFFFTLKLFKN